MKHVVSYSGGAGSWATAKRVADRYGYDDLILVFTDTRWEDEDLYRFLDESVRLMIPRGASYFELAEGRNIWQVFRDERFLGNSRIDPCSKILKRQLFRRWLEANFTPDEVTIYIGIGWDEDHRFEPARKRFEPYRLVAPMLEPPYLDRDQVFAWMAEDGPKPPRLYALGMPHNNCGGGCVKAGKAQFLQLLRVMPDRFKEWENNEQSLRDQLGNVSILTDRRGGIRKPMTLRQLREENEAKPCQTSLDDEWGGRGCFV